MYSVRYRNSANIEDDSPKDAIDAPTNVGTRNSERSSIGFDTRDSTTKNATSSSTAAVSMATIMVEPQPSALPRMSANTNRNRPPENVNRPGQSMPGALGSRFSEM